MVLIGDTLNAAPRVIRLDVDVVAVRKFNMQTSEKSGRIRWYGSGHVFGHNGDNVAAWF